jgi:hypothetical protein
MNTLMVNFGKNLDSYRSVRETVLEIEAIENSTQCSSSSPVLYEINFWI